MKKHYILIKGQYIKNVNIYASNNMPSKYAKHKQTELKRETVLQ